MRIIVPRKPCFLFLCLFLLLSRASAQIHPLVLPGTGYVYISASSTSICAGNSVTFTVTGTTDGGASPEFQWYVNGSDVAGGSTFTTSTLTNGASVHCVMYSSQSGISPATSSTITITVNPASAPSVSIAATATTICAGSSVTFTATPVNGGSTPSYQWQLNGGNISGATASTYTSTGISNGQVITCLMTSSSSCVTTPTDGECNSVVQPGNYSKPSVLSGVKRFLQLQSRKYSGKPDVPMEAEWSECQLQCDRASRVCIGY